MKCKNRKECGFYSEFGYCGLATGERCNYYKEELNNMEIRIHMDSQNKIRIITESNTLKRLLLNYSSILKLNAIVKNDRVVEISGKEKGLLQLIYILMEQFETIIID